MDFSMGQNPPRECSHSTCHKIIPLTEAGMKQYTTCADCCAWDAAARKRKRHGATHEASVTASEDISAEAQTGITARNGPNEQKRQRILHPTLTLDSSDDEHDTVSINDLQKLFPLSHHQR